MRIWRMLTVPLRSLVRRRATDDELDEEIRYHLERDVEQPEHVCVKDRER